MADLVIRGMEMPKDNNAISIIIFSNGKVSLAHDKKYAEYAEAVPLPAGHGKIIDGDALWENMTVEQSEAFQKGLAGTTDLFEMLEAATPIVPAEGGTDNG